MIVTNNCNQIGSSNSNIGRCIVRRRLNDCFGHFEISSIYLTYFWINFVLPQRAYSCNPAEARNGRAQLWKNKCFFNCLCFCCLNGCCIVPNDTDACHKATRKLEIGEFCEGDKYPHFVARFMNFLKLISLLSHIIDLIKKPKNCLLNIDQGGQKHDTIVTFRPIHTKWKATNAFIYTMTTDDHKSTIKKNNTTYVSYGGTTKDLRLQSNKLCKLCCNNRKSQRKRRKRRRIICSNAPHTGSNNIKYQYQTLQQIYDKNNKKYDSLSASKESNIILEMCFPTTLQRNYDLPLQDSKIRNNNSNYNYNNNTNYDNNDNDDNTDYNYYKNHKINNIFISKRSNYNNCKHHSFYIKWWKSIKRLNQLSRGSLLWLLIGLISIDVPRDIICNRINENNGYSFGPGNILLTKTYGSNTSATALKLSTKFIKRDSNHSKIILNNSIKHRYLHKITKGYLAWSSSQKLGINGSSCLYCHSELLDSKGHKIFHKDNNHITKSTYDNRKNNKIQSFHNSSSHHNMYYEKYSDSDRLRLESIKREILNKLGISHKPIIAHVLPKQLIWNTIYRTDSSIEEEFRVSGANDRRYSMKNAKSLFSRVLIRQAKRDLTNYSRRSSYYRKSSSTFGNNHSSNNTYEKEPHINQFERFVTDGKVLNEPYKHYSTSRIMNNSNSRRNSLFSDIQLRAPHQLHDSSNGANTDSASNSHDYLFLNDYNGQSKNMSNQLSEDNTRSDYHHNPEDNIRKEYRHKPSHAQGNMEYFKDSREIIVFSQEGAFFRNHKLVEFIIKRKDLQPKLRLESARIHLRVDKRLLYYGSDSPSESTKNKEHNINALHSHKLTIWICEIMESATSREKIPEKMIRFCVSFSVPNEQLGWQNFDLTDTIREWYCRNQSEKLNLLVDCTGCSKRYRVHLFESEKVNSDRKKVLSKPLGNVWQSKNQDMVFKESLSRPFLVLYVGAKKIRRIRRRAVDCGGALNGQCCKESFYVSFKALGWDDWIIAPRGYFANYCRGQCAGPFRTPDTFTSFNAHFIEEYRKIGLLNGMKPCCAPVKFSSMSLIYYGNDGIIKRDLPKMVVDECGCP